nr:putative leucine-rich repeat-containing protein DDB_G0290503 isoform X3 [Procambarus clarkii]
MFICRKNEDVQKSDIISLIPGLDAIIKDHFAGPKLICFEDVASGCQVELTKLLLLLLYITMITEDKLRNTLVRSPLMDTSTQIKLKYLIESIQKRGPGLSTKFLKILCTEKLEAKLQARCQTPIGPASACSPPNRYSNSPKMMPVSPLRDLVQSPPFRMEKVLNDKKKELRHLLHKVNVMENEKQDLAVNLEASNRKNEKLRGELSKKQKELQDVKMNRDELEAQMTAGDNLVQQQVQRLRKESSDLRKENATLEQTVNKVIETNDELTAKNENLRKRLTLVSAERDRLQEEMSTLHRAKMENEAIIESQAFHLKDVKAQLEELQHIFSEKPTNRPVEESFEATSPMTFTSAPSSPSQSNTSGENMAEAVVDKILFETRAQLSGINENYADLQEKFSEAVYNRDQLAVQDEVNTSHVTVLELKVELSKFVDQLSECSSKLMELEQKLQSSQQDLNLTRSALEEESKRNTVLQEQLITISRLNESFKCQIETQSEEHKLKVQELNTNIMALICERDLLTNDKASLVQEMQNLKTNYKNAKLQFDKDFAELATEKANLYSQIEIKSEALCHLQTEMESKLESLNKEKVNLEEEIAMKAANYTRLESELKVQVEQLTSDKVALSEDILKKELTCTNLKQEMDRNNNLLLELKESFKKEMEAKNETYLTLQNEKERELEIHAKKITSLNEIIKNKECDYSELKREMNKTINDLHQSQSVMCSEFKEREESFVVLKHKLEEDLATSAEVEKKLSNIVSQNERSYALLQLKMQEAEETFTHEKSTLMNDIQTKEDNLAKLKEEYKLTTESLECQNSTLSEAISVKEAALASSQEMINKLQDEMTAKNDDYCIVQQQLAVITAALKDEKCTLLQEIQAKESAYVSLRQELEKKLDDLSKEEIALKTLLQEKEEELGSLRKEFSESIEKSRSEKAAMAEELSSKTEYLNNLLSEKDQIIRRLAEEKEQSKNSFESKIAELNEVFSKKCEHVQVVEQDIITTKLSSEEKETRLREELSIVKLAMEDLQREKDEQAQSNENALSDLKSCLGEKIDSFVRIKEEHERSLQNHKTQTIEMQGIISELQSALAVKEEEFKSKLAVLREQMESVEADKIINEAKVADITTSVNRMEEEHRTSLNHLKKEAEQQQMKFDADVLLLGDKVSSLEREKAAAENEMQEKNDVMEALTLEFNTKIKALEMVVSVKAEAIEALEREATSLNAMVKAQEDALNALHQQVEGTLQTHSTETANLMREIAEREASYTCLQNELQNRVAALTEEKVSLGKMMQENEDVVSNRQQQINDLLAQVNEQKQVLCSEMNEKEKAFLSLRHEMESSMEVIKNRNNKELQEKQELICNLQKEKERDLKVYVEEKTAMNAIIKEKEEVITSLKLELEDIKNAFMSEKESLSNELNAHQESLTSLKDKHEKAQASSAAETNTLSLHVLEKDRKITELSEELKNMQEIQAIRIKQLEVDFEKVTSYLEAEQGLNLDLKSKIQSLQEEIKNKDAEYKRDLTCTQQEISTLKDCIEERKRLHEEVVQKTEEGTRENKSLIFQLQTTINEKNEIIKSLKEKILELEEKHSNAIQELNNAIAEKTSNLNAIKMELSELQKTNAQKQDKTDELNKFKNDLAMINKEIQEREKVSEAARTASVNKLKAAQEKLMEYKGRVQTLEASLIDKEQQILATKEEVMRVERESEKSTRSLSEELHAFKDKLRAEKKAVADRMKMSYQTELEKLMIQIEEKEQESKEKDRIQMKYELAKKKLTEILTFNNDLKTTNDHYEKQVAKYKDHVKGLETNLQRERTKQNEMTSRTMELEGKYQPLKEKLHESENVIKRLCNEKRSLEVQLNHADAKMREMKKQWDRESFGVVNTLAPSFTRSSVSASAVSHIREIIVTKPSTSSTEDEWEVNDSKQELLSNRPSTGTRKMMTRACSADTMFRKPSTRTTNSENKPKWDDGSHQVAAASATAAANTGATERKTVQSSDTNISDKSLGRSVPRDMHFNCEDEEELFSNKYLLDMQVGRCNPLEEAQWKRLSELQRRNSLYPPHMRSAYPAEMQSIPLQNFEDDKLREGCAVEDRQLMNLTEATENLGLDSPAFNLRKRKSLSESTQSESSIEFSGGKRTKRLSTSYSRPGPPTPGRKSLAKGDKENRRESIASNASLSSLGYRGRKGSPPGAYSGASPVSTRVRQVRSTRTSHSVPSPSLSSGAPSRSPNNVTMLSKKGATPRGKKGMTPSSLRKILAKGKSPWRKIDNDQETPKGLGDSSNSNGSSKLRIFRRPFGSKNYNVLSASLRSQENPNDLNDSLTVSTGRSDPTIIKKTRGKR